MNCKNANKELGFDIFSECNYNLHWSFSNFNRILMAAGYIAQLPQSSIVLELGAGSSDLENIVRKNFNRKDIIFNKVDGDESHKGKCSIVDITSDNFDEICSGYVSEVAPFDAIVFMEVVEHLDKQDVIPMLNKIAKWLKPEGLLLFTTPTPPYNAMYEDRVWPTDHKIEYTLLEIYNMINENFKIIKRIGWSLEEREYNELLESDEDLGMIYLKLKGAFPESYIRAIIACLSPVEANRQIFLVCKKRRIANGRLA